MSATTSGHVSIWAPEAIVALNRAYAEACNILATERVEHGVRVKMAEHMMYLARNGETDAERLCSLSVLAVLGRKSPPRESGAGRDRTTGPCAVALGRL